MRASSTTGNIKVPVLRGLDAEAVSGPSQKRSRPGDAPEPSLTPRGTCPARFTTLAEARWAFKTRVGAVERSLEFTASMQERTGSPVPGDRSDDRPAAASIMSKRLKGLMRDHLASRSTSCGSGESPVELAVF
eukprot:g30422.t1